MHPARVYDVSKLGQNSSRIHSPSFGVPISKILPPIYEERAACSDTFACLLGVVDPMGSIAKLLFFVYDCRLVPRHYYMPRSFLLLDSSRDRSPFRWRA